MVAFKQNAKDVKLENIKIAEFYSDPDDLKHPLIRIFYLSNGEKVIVSNSENVVWKHEKLANQKIHFAEHAKLRDPLLKLQELGNGSLMTPIPDLRKGYVFSIVPKDSLTEEMLQN